MKLINLNFRKKMQEKTDDELVLYYKQSFDTEIIGELYKRYHHIVLGIALKYLKDTEQAQDAVLDIFNHLFEQLLKYKIDDFKSWLLTVTRNYCLKQIKDHNRYTPVEFINQNILSINFMENEHEIDHHIDKEKQIEKLEEALTKLKPEQKECISMFYIEDKSYQDISEITGYTIKKVKSYIQNGKRNLQILMTKK